MDIELAGCTGGGIGAVSRTCTTAYHGGDSAVKGCSHLSWRDKMNVRVKSACGEDKSLACDSFRGSAYYHVFVNAIHDVRVACFAYSCYPAVLYANVSLYDACAVDDKSVCDNSVKALLVSGFAGLPHAVTERFSSTELCFITMDCQIFFHFCNKRSVAQAHPVANCRAIHIAVGFSRYLDHFLHPLEAKLLAFSKAACLMFSSSIFPFTRPFRP